MRLGIGSYTFPWAVGIPGHAPAEPLTALGLLDRAADLGVGVVQVCDNLPLHALAEDELNGFASRASDLGIEVEVGTRGIAAEHLRTYLRLAERLGSPIVRVVVDTAEHQPSPEEVVGLLGEVVGDFEGADVCLAIENHGRFRAATFAWIVEQLASRAVGICLDTANSFGALEGPGVVMETLAPHVVNLHVKDFCVRRLSHNLGFTVEGRPAGQGQLDIPGLLRTVAANGRGANATLELWTPPEDDLAATIAKEARWAEESVAYLKSQLRNP